MAGGTAHLWTSAILLTLVLHYAWEMGQARLFTNFAGMSLLQHAVTCLLASLGDLVIAIVAYLITAAAFKRPAWVLHANWYSPALLWLALGLAITVAIERWSLAKGRWAYSPAMPTVLGIGVAPLLQWIVLPLATLAIFRWLAARVPDAGGRS